MDRTDRISEEIRRVMSDIIMNDVKDPRLPAFVSVTGVRVVKDLKHAKVFISVLGTPEEKAEAIRALVHAAGYIRREIGQRVRIRYTPELHFELDDSIEHGIHINRLITETMAHSAQQAATTKKEQPEAEPTEAESTEAESTAEEDAGAEIETEDAVGRSSDAGSDDASDAE